MGRRLLALTVVVALLSAMVGVVPAAAWTSVREPELISRDDAGAAGTESSSGPVVSEDGRYVAFCSESMFDATDPNMGRDVYRLDRTTGEMLLITAHRAGENAGGEWINQFDMSDDGSRFVVVTYRDLVAEDTEWASDVYVIDVDPLTDALETTRLDFTGLNPWMDLSGDGGTILMDLTDSLVPEDTVSGRDVYAYVLATDALIWVSEPPAGALAADRGSRLAGISDDGRYAGIFTGKDLVPEDVNAGEYTGQDIYVIDLTDGTARLVNIWADPLDSDSGVWDLRMSGDGSTFVFTTDDSLVPEDDNYPVDVYAVDVETAEVTWLTVPPAGADEPERGSRSPAISDDGRFVALHTGKDLAIEDDNHEQDIYLLDLGAGTATRVDLTGVGDPIGNDVHDYAISGSGAVLSFTSLVALDPLDVNSTYDVYAVELFSVIAGLDTYAAARNTMLSVDASSGVLANDTSIDELPLTIALLDDVLNGALVLAPDGSFEYTPDAGYIGEDTFTYLVSDGGDPVVGVVTITVSNTPPTAAADSYDVTGATLVVDSPGVLGNDSDANGDAIAAHKVTGPAHGTLTLDADGSFLYRPASGYSGADSFTYRVSDGLDFSDPATVSFAVTAPPVNTVPVASGDAYATAAGVPLAIDAPGVLGNDTDADDDALSAIKVTGPAHGTLALDADGSFVYIADAGFSGADGFTYKVFDGSAYSAPAAVTVTVSAAVPPTIDVAGSTRIDTAIAASVLAFPGGADTVVLATAMNWPDALGGGALAGVLDAPVLLTGPDALPQAVADEIARLGATKVVIIGGVGAVSADVASAIDSAITVERIAGDDRYKTAEAVAARVITEQGTGFDGTALVATGGDFADALAAAPLAAAQGWPLYLVNPVSGLSDASKTALGGMMEVVILGGEGAVSKPVFDYLEGELGEGAVVRLGGENRYATAVVIATYAVDEVGHVWDGVGIAKGEDFPDALAGGVLQGKAGSVMLLTSSTDLSAATRAALLANADEIDTVHFYGGTGAISQLVRDAVAGVVK